jgi:hypothetical protein
MQGALHFPDYSGQLYPNRNQRALQMRAEWRRRCRAIVHLSRHPASPRAVKTSPCRHRQLLFREREQRT